MNKTIPTVRKQMEALKQASTPGNKIDFLDIEMRYPYADYSLYDQIPDTNDRYEYAVGPIEKMSRIPEWIDVDDDPLIVQMQKFAAVRFSRICEEKGMDGVWIEEETNLDKTLISRYRSLKRPLSSLPVYLPPVAYNVANISVHNMMFGEEGKIYLPQFFSCFANILLKMSSQNLVQVYREARNMYANMPANPEQPARSMPKRNQYYITKERICYLADSIGCAPTNICGTGIKSKIRNIIRVYFDNDLNNITPKLNTLMFLSLETGMALDWFISENFGAYVPIYYDTGALSTKPAPENKRKRSYERLSNQVIIHILEILAALDSEDREYLGGYILAKSL